MATFSTRLQELKETKKLLQKDAAKALDVPLRTYQRYEHGQQVSAPPVCFVVLFHSFHRILHFLLLFYRKAVPIWLRSPP